MGVKSRQVVRCREMSEIHDGDYRSAEHRSAQLPFWLRAALPEHGSATRSRSHRLKLWSLPKCYALRVTDPRSELVKLKFPFSNI